jgi:hypothetical protein
VKLWAAGDRAAALELAKHHEHQARDFAAAASITRAMLDGASAQPEVEALEARLSRVRRKAVTRG